MKLVFLLPTFVFVQLLTINASSFYSDFESGVPTEFENYLEGTTPSWSGPDLSNIPLAALPSGRTGATDDYMWINDNSSTTISTDRFQMFFADLDGATSFSYFFHDRWDGTSGNNNFTDVAIMDSSMNSILIADIFFEDGATDSWSEVSGTFTTDTPWRVFSDPAIDFIRGGTSLNVLNHGTLATQFQIDAILSGGMIFHFGFEQISGGHSGDINAREAIAVDNFSIIPEPTTGILAVIGLAAFGGRRRGRRKV